MGLANSHPHKTRMVCVHNVDVEVICGSSNDAQFCDSDKSRNMCMKMDVQ